MFNVSLAFNLIFLSTIKKPSFYNRQGLVLQLNASCNKKKHAGTLCNITRLVIARQIILSFSSKNGIRDASEITSGYR